jgi:hypothetical protein
MQLTKEFLAVAGLTPEENRHRLHTCPLARGSRAYPKMSLDLHAILIGVPRTALSFDNEALRRSSASWCRRPGLTDMPPCIGASVSPCDVFPNFVGYCRERV